MSERWLDAIKWNAEGLVPVIAQEVVSGKVLMLAWMNREALTATLREGKAVYWSRSRERLWRKGEESGHEQWVKDVRLDCDHDTVLISVAQQGGIACHTGRERCFYRQLRDGQWVDSEPVLKAPVQIYGNGD